jgi:hypothetical protein
MVRKTNSKCSQAKTEIVKQTGSTIVDNTTQQIQQVVESYSLQNNNRFGKAKVDVDKI